MRRLSPNMKVRNPLFIPPIGRLDDSILNLSVKIKNNNNQVFDITVSEYLNNPRGMTSGPAFDGLSYDEVLEDKGNDNIFRSLATIYIPAESSLSSAKIPYYVATSSNQASFHIVSFLDKTSNMTEDLKIQAINRALQGYTVKGKLKYIGVLHSNRILVLEDDSELIIKSTDSCSYVRIETQDGINTGKWYNDKFLWELVDRNLSDPDIIQFLSGVYNSNDKINDLDLEVNNIDKKMTAISDKIDSLEYRLDSTKTTVNFLANKIAEQKNQIASVEGSISSSARMLLNIIDHVDKEQGTTYLKLEDLSQSIQSLNVALAALTTLPSKLENSLNMDNEIIQVLERIEIVVKQLNEFNQKPQEHETSKNERLITILTVANLLLKIITLVARKENTDYNEMD